MLLVSLARLHRSSLELGISVVNNVHSARRRSAFRHHRLRIDDAVASRGGLNHIGVLRFEDGEFFLGFPVEPRIGSKEKIHLFQTALIGFGVKSPDYGNSESVARTENVKSLLSDMLKHDGA